MKTFTIAVIAGDGVGTEVVPQAKSVLDAIAAKHNLTFVFEDFDWGSDHFFRWGRMMPAGAIDRLLDQFDRHADVAVAGPRLVDAGGRAELSFGRMVGPLNEWRQKHATGVEEATRREHFPDWVSGACLLVRRATQPSIVFIGLSNDLITRSTGSRLEKARQ